MIRHSMRVWSVILATFAALSIASAAENSPSIPKIGADASTFTLENGLQVVVIPDRRVPVVTHMIWYKVGSADEPESQSGVAHFLEHLMFKGTTNHPGDEFSKTVSRLGGRENAFTSTDYTGYFQRVAKSHLGLMMKFEADRMSNLVLTDPVVKPERDVVLEERRSRIENDPSTQLGEVLDAALFVNHPYGDPVIGWKHEILALNRDKAIAFYDRFYTPENAIVVIAGDVTDDEVRRLAAETYAKVKQRATIAPRKRSQVPDLGAARRVIKKDDRVSQPSMRRSYLVPSYTTAEPGEAEALDILADILGSGKNSRLYKTLVVDKKLAAGAGGWYQSSGLDHVRFMVYGVPRENVTLDQLETAIDEVIADVLDNGVTEEEVERAKRKMIADAIYAQDSQSSLARIFGVTLTTGGTIAAVQNWPEAISKVTKERVLDVAKRYLVLERSVTGHLVGGDKPKT